MKIGRRFTSVVASSAILMLSALFFAGCSGSSSMPPSQGLPAPAPAGQITTYIGTQSPGDVWNVTIDHLAHSFSLTDLSARTPPVNGLFASDGGFLNLSETNTPPAFQPAGFALEIPGRAALVRPGFNTAPLVPLVVQTTCPNFNPVTLQFVALPSSAWVLGTDTAYGILQVGATGTAWNFYTLRQFTLGGLSNQPGAVLSAGVCAQSLAGIVVTIPPNPATMALGPSGFFVIDEGPGNPGKVGVIQPATALNTSSVVNSVYLGFMYEPAAGLAGLPVTQLAAFGCSGSSCPSPPSPTSLVGGVFPTDDPSTPANTDTFIDLGQQDSASKGLYRKSQVTIPDPFAVCGTGTGTCTLPAVAVVGNPEGKFAIFLIAQDTVNSSPMVMILYQQ